MINQKIKQRKASLAELMAQDEGFNIRSAELETAIGETKTDEEVTAVEGEIEKLDTERAELGEKKTKLEGEITALEGELEELNSKEPLVNPVVVPVERSKKNEGDETRMRKNTFFRGMERNAVDNLLVREDIKEFTTRARELMTQKRAVTGAELNFPNVLLEILRDNLNQYSKLISKVNVKTVSGKARQNVAGAVVEAIWTEAVGKINEMSIVFNQVEVDGYKVGGFIAVPNSTLEDSDLNLVSEIMTALGQGLGLGIDKAILYGKGVKMPVGIVTRLAETVKPAYWGDNEKAWTDLHTSNLLLIDAAASTDVLFFKDLILKLGKVKANYSNGQKFWVMNTNTFATLQAKALTINAAGAIVSGQTQTMPIVGGEVVFLDFVPDNVVVGGYGSLYLLAERAGATLAQSEHVQFIEDNTVFKGTARYDGRPVFGEAFIAINISQEDLEVAPTATAVTFTADTANV